MTQKLVTAISLSASRGWFSRAAIQNVHANIYRHLWTRRLSSSSFRPPTEYDVIFPKSSTDGFHHNQYKLSTATTGTPDALGTMAESDSNKSGESTEPTKEKSNITPDAKSPPKEWQSDPPTQKQSSESNLGTASRPNIASNSKAGSTLKPSGTYRPYKAYDAYDPQGTRVISQRYNTPGNRDFAESLWPGRIALFAAAGGAAGTVYMIMKGAKLALLKGCSIVYNRNTIQQESIDGFKVAFHDREKAKITAPRKPSSKKSKEPLQLASAAAVAVASLLTDDKFDTEASPTKAAEKEANAATTPEVFPTAPSDQITPTKAKFPVCLHAHEGVVEMSTGVKEEGVVAESSQEREVDNVDVVEKVSSGSAVGAQLPELHPIEAPKKPPIKNSNAAPIQAASASTVAVALLPADDLPETESSSTKSVDATTPEISPAMEPEVGNVAVVENVEEGASGKSAAVDAPEAIVVGVPSHEASDSLEASPVSTEEAVEKDDDETFPGSDGPTNKPVDHVNNSENSTTEPSVNNDANGDDDEEEVPVEDLTIPENIRFLLVELRSLISQENITTAYDDCVEFSKDAYSHHHGRVPSVVVTPSRLR